MKNIKLALLLLSSVFFMVSCSDKDSSSVDSADTEVSSEISDSIEVTEPSEDVSIEEQTDAAAKSCEVSMDSNKLNKGVNFEDEELVAKSEEFVGEILSVYEPAEKPADTDNQKGSYLALKILDQNGETVHDININNSGAVWVNIDGLSYQTDNGEPAEFYEYVTGFLSENGY